MTETFKLADGNIIPAIAFGCGSKWFKYGQPGINQELIDITQKAIDLGFTHLDCAEIYNTDREVGKAIEATKKPRTDLFITDKYFSGTRDYVHKSSASSPYEALKASLARYTIEYVDLYLLHSEHIKKETHGFTIAEAWASMEKLKEEGLTKSIGVSNFTVGSLQEILNSSPKYKPVVLQIEYSPHLQNQSAGIVEFAKDHGILVEAYGSLAPLTVPSTDDSPLLEYICALAAKYGRSENEVILRWVYQNGILPITSSANESRIKGYLSIFSFKLTVDEQQKISELGSLRKVQKYLDTAPKVSETEAN